MGKGEGKGKGKEKEKRGKEKREKRKQQQRQKEMGKVNAATAKRVQKSHLVLLDSCVRTNADVVVNVKME